MNNKKNNLLRKYLWDKSIQSDVDGFSEQFEPHFSEKLLSSLVYYSYYDFVQLLYSLVHRIKLKLYSEEFLKNNDLTDSQFENIWKNHLKESCFVAITDEVGASSHIMLSILKNRIYDLSLTKDELCTLEEIKEKAETGKKYFYVLDDFIGRGDQIYSILIHTQRLSSLQRSNPNITITLVFAIVLRDGLRRIIDNLNINIIYVVVFNNEMYDITNRHSIFWNDDNSLYEHFVSEYQIHDRNFYEIDIKNNEKRRSEYSQNIPFLFFHCSPPSSVRLFWDDDTIGDIKALKKRITRGGKN